MLMIAPDSGEIVYANRAAEAFYGYPDGVLTRMNISEINQLSPEEIKQEMDQAIEARKNRFTFLHKLANGDVRTVEVHSSKITFESLDYLYSVIHDVSELKHFQEMITYERERYRDLLESQPIGIYRIRIFPLATWKDEAWLSSKAAPFVVEVINDRFCEILGLNREACLNNPGILTDLVHPEDKAAFAKDNADANANLNKFNWEGRLIIDGEIRWVHFESLPKALTDGDVIWTGSLQDITARKRAEEELRKTEQKLRLTIENSTNLFYMHTADHVLTYVSPQSRDFFDCKPEEAMIRWADFLTDNPDNQEGFLATQRAIDTGKRQPPYQIECVGKRGRKIWVEVNEAPIIENGRTVAISGTLTDITKRKQAEQEREQYFSFFQTSADLMCIADPHSNFLKVNPAFEATLGYSEKELFSKPILEFVYPEDRQATLDEIARQQQSGCTDNFENRYICKDGSIKWLSWRVNVSRDKGVVYASARDITELKKTEDDLKQLTENLKLKNAELERFVYTASHDLKTPLVTISGFSGILKHALGESSDEAILSSLNFIDSAAEKMNQLLNDLLIYSRNDHLPHNNETLCLNDLVQDVMRDFEWLLEEKQIRYKISQNLPVILGDRSQLCQVFQNLVANAIKFMGEQTKPFIEIGAAMTDEGFACYVRDNGIGILPQYQSSVFGLFKRLSTDDKGTGVGLALVKQIVERHDGDVWIESTGEEGKGTTFWLSFNQEIKTTTP
jgi:PAS domain S-box-containing protein